MKAHVVKTFKNTSQYLNYKAFPIFYNSKNIEK